VKDEEFIDQLLEGWGAWADEDGLSQKPTAAYVVLKIAVEIEANFGFVLSDDGFLLIDRGIRQLPDELRAVFDVEYRYTRGEGLTQEQKAYFLGLKRTVYRERLAQAQRTLLTFLEPNIDFGGRKASVSARG
jgi:hypothetical protein